MPAMVSRMAPANQKGSAMGVFSSGQFFGAFLGGMIGGMIASIESGQAVFAAATLIGLIWLAIAWGMVVPPRSKLISLITDTETEQQAEDLAARLVELDGVLEATVVWEENRTYLKVNDKIFNLEQARQVVGLN